MLSQFPARPTESSWAETAATRDEVLARLLAPPFPAVNINRQLARRIGLMKTLAWLESFPGSTWQQRWSETGAEDTGNVQWRHVARVWLQAQRRSSVTEEVDFNTLGRGMIQLISGDVIRPSMWWLMTPQTLRTLYDEIARVRDPDGFDQLHRLCAADSMNSQTKQLATRRIATILAAKGGVVRDITVGDCLELVDVLRGFDNNSDDRAGRYVPGSVYFYQLLHGIGVFPAGAIPTIRIFATNATGRADAAQMIDSYDIVCQPIRDMLVEYLRERSPGLDYSSQRSLALGLGRLFWKDLEVHHPGIDSLRLSPQVAAAWKQNHHRWGT